MAAVKFLAFDLGASSGRSILGAFQNGKLELEETHRFPNTMVKMSGHYHWDLPALWQNLLTGLSKTVSQQHNIASIGIDTWGVDFGLLHGSTILGNPYAYRDLDSFYVMDEICKTIPKDELYRQTGIQFMPFNSIFQLYRLKMNASPLLPIADKLLFTPDLLNFLFTGEKVSEYSIASTSQLLDPFARQWNKQLFDHLQLPLDIMADIVMPGTRIGTLTKDNQEQTGAGAVPVIAPACHDTGSAVAAVPASGKNWAYLSSGTWSLMGIESAEPIVNDQSAAMNFTNEGGVNGSIRFLRNLSGLWLLQCLKSAWEKDGESIGYADMTKMADAAQPFTCLIDPDDERFINPSDMRQAINSYCQHTGQDAPQTKGEYIRCCLESLAMKYRDCLQQMNSLTPEPVEILHIVGGGTQNELLNQFAANATGVPVLAGPIEATAIGNLMVQAVASGELSSIEEGRGMVKNSFPMMEYEPQDVSLWDEKFEKFIRILGN